MFALVWLRRIVGHSLVKSAQAARRRARPEQIDHNRKNQSAKIQHPAKDHPILHPTPTG
jgi:hypothetical protein